MNTNNDQRTVITAATIKKELVKQQNTLLALLIGSIVCVIVMIVIFVLSWMWNLYDGLEPRDQLLSKVRSLVVIIGMVYFCYHIYKLFIKYIKIRWIISSGYFNVEEDTVECAGPIEYDHALRKYVYPIVFEKNGTALELPTFKWKEYLGKGDKCIVVVYDRVKYDGHYRIAKVYPSKFFKYQNNI